MPKYTTIIEPASLISLQRAAPKGASGALLIFDCRARLGDPNWGLQAFLTGHVPGAQHLDLDRNLASPPGAGGRHPLPDPGQLAQHLRQAGVCNHSQIVLYDDAAGAFASRAWWCLRWLGHAGVAVLDGGLPAYTRLATQPLQTGPSAARAMGNFSPSQPLTKQASVAEVLALCQAANPSATLLDARSLARFEGREEPIDPIAGHIPGAQCHPFTSNLDERGHFKSKAALARMFAGLSDAVVCYCGSGVTATHNILALVHAGHPEPALYAGSWSHWIVDPERPRVP